MGDDKVLAAVCLSDEDDMATATMLASGRQTARMRMAAALLGSYERQVQSVEGSLRVCSQGLHNLVCLTVQAFVWEETTVQLAGMKDVCFAAMNDSARSNQPCTAGIKNSLVLLSSCIYLSVQTMDSCVVWR